MKYVKSERLKKLEAEINDLEHWLKLGLVPKKDIEKHKEEMQNLQNKIDEERERLHFLKESGEAEEYSAPKRPQTRTSYSEMPTVPDIDVGETGVGLSETTFDVDGEATESEGSFTEDKDDAEDKADDVDDNEDDESYFSDRNRWKRGGIIDPDADQW